MELVEFRFKVGNRYNTAEVATNETALKLQNSNIVELDLRPIENLSRIESISLQGNDLEGINLEPLKTCKSLRFLYLHDNKLREVNLKPLANCCGFMDINLNRNQLSAIDFSPFSGSKSIHELALMGNKLTSIDLSPLANTSIASLRLDDNTITEIDLSALRNCGNLHKLTIANNNLTSIDLSPLPRSLTTLWLYMNNLEAIDLNPLQYVNRLQNLRLERNLITDIDLNPLWSAKLLRKLNLTNNRIKNLDVSALFNCSELKSLDVDNNVSLIANPDYEQIMRLPEALEGYKPKIEWKVSNSQKLQPRMKRELISSGKFENIQPKHLYLQLVKEINDSFHFGCYTATMILYRKLVENLVLEIILASFKRGSAEVQEFYDKKKGRVKDFSKLIDFFKQHREDLTRSSAISRKDLNSLISKVNEVKDKLNAFTHILQHHAIESDVMRIKDKLNFILDSLILICVRCC